MIIKQEYKTILVMVIGFSIIGYLFKLKWLFYFSLGVLIISIINNRMANLIADLWMKFGKAIGAINSKIILSVFFVFILTPLAYIKRMFGHTPKQNNHTSWIQVKEEERVNFNDPW